MIVTTMLLLGNLAAQTPDDVRIPAQLRILVPEDAFVFVAREKTYSTGGERLFESPPLQVGKRYVYEVSVIHEGREIVRRVRLGAGELIEVDFRAEFLNVTSGPARPFKPIKPEWLPRRIWFA